MNQQPGRLCAAGLFSFLCMGILMPALFKPSPWGEGGPKGRMRGQWKITLRLQRIPPSADGGLLCPRRQSNQNAAGVCSEEHRSGAPSRRTPDPHYEGRVPAEFYKISGAQNLSGISQFNPGHWALGLQKLLLLRLLFRAWLDRAGGGWC